jgi:membrane fusion protein, multidrug efflux system
MGKPLQKCNNIEIMRYFFQNFFFPTDKSVGGGLNPDGLQTPNPKGFNTQPTDLSVENTAISTSDKSLGRRVNPHGLQTSNPKGFNTQPTDLSVGNTAISISDKSVGGGINPDGLQTPNPKGFNTQPTDLSVGNTAINLSVGNTAISTSDKSVGGGVNPYGLQTPNPKGFNTQPTDLSVGNTAISLLLLALFFAACGKKDAPVAASAVVDEAIPVRTVLVQQKTVTLPIYASGMLTSSAEQRLSFKIGGVIRKTYVEEGDVVRPGQLLAVLDKTEIDAQVVQAQQGLAKAERDLARVDGLYRDSSATLELLQNATTGRDVAKETVRIAAFNQQYAEIRATKGGKIIKKLMNEGEITGPGTPVFVLFETGTNDWIVEINTSDRDWARLNKGMPAKVTMDAYPGTVFNCKVTDLAPAADPQSGLYPVEIGIAPHGQRFAPGLFAQVEITPAQSRPYNMVPVECIVEGNGKTAYVYAVQADGSSVRKVPVQIAFATGAQVLIASGLEGVTEVVTSGAPYLTEKKKIKKM